MAASAHGLNVSKKVLSNGPLDTLSVISETTACVKEKSKSTEARYASVRLRKQAAHRL